MTVAFDLVEVNPGDTLYIGVYDAFNSTGDTTNAYGYDVLANVDAGPPSISVAVEAEGISAWANKSPGLWGPMQLGSAVVTELALFSIGGAEDNSALAGTAQSFTFTSGANDVMIFIGVSSLTSEGLRGSIDNLTITSDEGGSGTTWAGFDVDDQGNVDTGPWLGFLNINEGVWVWSYSLNSWMYLPEELVSESGSWSYVIN
jgi:hypothetical protein